VKILDMGCQKTSRPTSSLSTRRRERCSARRTISRRNSEGRTKIDGRADIYSLGATLYSLITGATPFKGATQALVMMMHISEPLKNPKDLVPDLPDDANRLIMKMMAKTPEERFANCDEVIGEMERILATLPKHRPRRNAARSSRRCRTTKRRRRSNVRCRFRPSRRLRPCLRRKSLRRSAHRRRPRRSKRLPCRFASTHAGNSHRDDRHRARARRSSAQVIPACFHRGGGGAGGADRRARCCADRGLSNSDASKAAQACQRRRSAPPAPPPPR